MSSFRLREDVAKGRFLDIMASMDSKTLQFNPEKVAEQAVRDADALIAALTSSEKQYRGCMDCYGSGGKRGNPCGRCLGTGRIPA